MIGPVYAHACAVRRAMVLESATGAAGEL